jgi:dipeptidyl aminopeptidase/acylaminoacyl peptidase
LTASSDGLVHVAATMRKLCEIHCVDWDGANSRRLSNFNRTWFKSRLRPRVIKRSFHAPDGNGRTHPVDTWLLMPPTGTAPFPVFIDMHGGPQSGALIDFSNHLYWYRLVSSGWMVVAPNTVGSSGYGDRFARCLRGQWGELDLPQHLSILEQLRAEGWAGDIAGCGGKSYGGYLSAWAAGHCDAFDAIVISAPVADVVSHSGTSDSGYYVSPYAMGGELVDIRPRYEALSPERSIHTACAPVLLLQGEEDQRCPADQSEQLFAALVRSGRPAKMVIYPSGTHSMAATGKPSHRVDYHERITEWMRAVVSKDAQLPQGVVNVPRVDGSSEVPASNTIETGALERQVRAGSMKRM